MTAAPEECVRRHFRIAKDQIGYVKFVVEAYEGVAQVTSRPGRAEMEWIIPPDQLKEADELAAALKEEVGLTEIEGE